MALTLFVTMPLRLHTVPDGAPGRMRRATGVSVKRPRLYSKGRKRDAFLTGRPSMTRAKTPGSAAVCSDLEPLTTDLLSTCLSFPVERTDSFAVN
jgi:hypothetical protein